MASTKSNVLWVTCRAGGSIVGIMPKHGNGLILPLFSSSKSAGEWLMAMRLEAHIVSPPLYPRQVADLLHAARKDGYTHVTLNPSSDITAAFRTANIDHFRQVAESKCR